MPTPRRCDWWRNRWRATNMCGTLRAMASSSSPNNGPSLTARLLAESFGCMMFHFVGSVAPTAAANGVILMVIVYHLAKVSGAHLNPAVTLTFSLLGHTSPLEVLAYWVAQVVGCIMGALWMAALVPGLYMRPHELGTTDVTRYDGCFRPRDDLSAAQIFGWEAVGTFCFLVPIFSVVWYTQNKSGYGNTGPLIVGLSLMGTAMAVGPFTGAALNPARAVGSPAVFRCGDHPCRMLLYYVLGEFAGAAVVPVAILPWYGIAADPWYRRQQQTLSPESSSPELSYPESTNETVQESDMSNRPHTPHPPPHMQIRLTNSHSVDSSMHASNGRRSNEKTYTWGGGTPQQSQMGYAYRNRLVCSPTRSVASISGSNNVDKSPLHDTVFGSYIAVPTPSDATQRPPSQLSRRQYSLEMPTARCIEIPMSHSSQLPKTNCGGGDAPITVIKINLDDDA